MNAEPMSPAKLDELYESIVDSLNQHADPVLGELNRRWVKNPDFQSLGVTTSDFRATLKSYKQRVLQLSLEERLSLANRLVASGINEEAGFANWIISLSVDEIDREQLKYFDNYLEHFHSWGTTDDFCINVLQPLLHRYPTGILSILKKWNRSTNRWKCRASVVAFTRKVGSSGEFTDEVLRLCENLIWDEDDLVQKGVGWALKDNMRGAKGRVLKYIEDLRRRGVSSTITLYAIRDLKGKERKRALEISPSNSGK